MMVVKIQHSGESSTWSKWLCIAHTVQEALCDTPQVHQCSTRSNKIKVFRCVKASQAVHTVRQPPILKGARSDVQQLVL